MKSILHLPIDIVREICLYLNALDISAWDSLSPQFSQCKLRNGAVQRLSLGLDLVGDREAENSRIRRMVTPGNIWVPRLFNSYQNIASVTLSTFGMPEGRDLTPPISMLTAWGSTLRELRLASPRLLFLLVSPEYLAMCPPLMVLSPNRNAERLFEAIAKSGTAVSAGTTNSVEGATPTAVPNPWISLGSILPVLTLLDLYVIAYPKGQRIQMPFMPLFGEHFHRSLPPSLIEFSTNIFDHKLPRLTSSLPRSLIRLNYTNQTMFPLLAIDSADYFHNGAPLYLPPLLDTLTSSGNSYTMESIAELQNLTCLNARVDSQSPRGLVNPPEPQPQFPSSLLHITSPFSASEISDIWVLNLPPRLITFEHTGGLSPHLTNSCFAMFPRTLTALYLPSVRVDTKTCFTDLPPNLKTLSIDFISAPGSTIISLQRAATSDIYFPVLDDVLALPETLTHISISSRWANAALLNTDEQARLRLSRLPLTAFPCHAILSGLSMNLSIILDETSWKACPRLTYLNVTETAATADAIQHWPTHLKGRRNYPLNAPDIVL